jgi:hypothetical protein
MQTHSTPAYKLTRPIITGCVFIGEEYVYDNIKGVLSHKIDNKLRTQKVGDIEGAYAQYQTKSGEIIAY